MTMSNKEKANAPAKYARRAGEWSPNPTLTRRSWGNVQHVKQARARHEESESMPLGAPVPIAWPPRRPLGVCASTQ